MSKVAGTEDGEDFGALESPGPLQRSSHCPGPLTLALQGHKSVLSDLVAFQEAPELHIFLM